MEAHSDLGMREGEGGAVQVSWACSQAMLVIERSRAWGEAYEGWRVKLRGCRISLQAAADRYMQRGTKTSLGTGRSKIVGEQSQWKTLVLTFIPGATFAS